MRTNVAALLFVLFLCPSFALCQETEGDAHTDPSTAPTPRVFSEEEAAAFLESVGDGDAAAVRRLLAAGMTAGFGRERRQQVLSRAMRGGHVGVVEALLEADARLDPDERVDLEDALMSAIRLAQPRIVRLLLAHGADAKTGDSENHTALMIVAASASIADLPPEALRAVLGDNDEEDEESEEAELYRRAPKEERFEILRMLLDGGAEVNAVAGDCGLNALIMAAMYGSPEVARLLLDKGADPNVGTKKWNALSFATMSFEEWRGEFSNGGNGDTGGGSEEAQLKLNHLYFATAAGRAEVAAMLRKAGARELWQWPEEKEEEEEQTEPVEAPAVENQKPPAR